MKELLVFDLDGTLMNRQQVLSSTTRDVLSTLQHRGVHFTIATGRTRSTAEPCYQGFRFGLPQVYKNGANIWDPVIGQYTTRRHLDNDEAHRILSLAAPRIVNMFVFAMDEQHRSCFWYQEHPKLKTKETKLRGILEELKLNPEHIHWEERSAGDFNNNIINMLAMGKAGEILGLVKDLEAVGQWTIHYSADMYYPGYYWLDVHHKDVSKGKAIHQLKQDLDYQYVIAFGDASNDRELFEIANEAYAPANAEESLQALATDIIGHHDDDAIAHFLIERYNL